ncbi:hypothetical protein C8R48DRAFT_764575 [Suillus tomentosus]|nr:hypothetical protein C8R48DRAFT_764575 [Suillus tomentosus]
MSIEGRIMNYNCVWENSTVLLCPVVYSKHTYKSAFSIGCTLAQNSIGSDNSFILLISVKTAAEDDPVIILNGSQHSCDALIIHRVEDHVHVSLDITQVEVSEFSSEFQSLAEQFGSPDHQLKLVGILRKLWNDIVDPVVQALSELNVRPGSTIREEERQQVSRDASSQHFVAIGQGNPVKGKELKCVAFELAVVAQHVALIVSFTSLEDDNAIANGALDALNHNKWLHLACHGMPNQTQPFKSSFAMHDGPLMTRDII